ncbi:hypothetical protein [Robertkochia sediminum]|uniref:hypothetical protein n=1 Tax=Robertkochia sediminum TaxID=2785326 RepID=UPI0019334FBC|nr:hypothetical protein [Robertkochia sediminum]MBL7472030.1 hypothetical protein [Robertkochia sediminum]
MMTLALVKMITVFITSLVTLSAAPQLQDPIRGENQIVASFYEETPEVFSILDHKCNVCHKRRNRRRVFTPENMGSYKNEIYTQVFVKKRMPKGNSIRLTTKEQQELLTWISSTKIERHGI